MQMKIESNGKVVSKLSPAKLSTGYALWGLFAICTVYIITMSWGLHDYFFHYDHMVYLCPGHSSIPWLDSLVARDHTLRFRPVLFTVFRLEHFLFGFQGVGYVAFNLLVHSFNAFAVFFLCRRLSANVVVSFLSSILFLTSFLNWGVTSEITSIARCTALLLYLLGVISFIKNLKQNNSGIWLGPLVCFVFSMVCGEESITFPILLILSTLLFSGTYVGLQRQRSSIATIGLCLLVMMVYLVVIGKMGVDPGYNLHVGWHSAQKLLMLPREVIQCLFIPRREWGLSESLLVRLIPLFVILGSIVGLLLSAPKGQNLNSSARQKAFILFAFCWTLITAIPYLARPSGWTWHNRYLYFPSIGVFMLCGAAMEASYRKALALFSHRVLAKGLIGAIVGYMMVFGLFSTILIWQGMALSVGKCFPVGARETGMVFGLVRELQELKVREGDQIRLVIRGSPLALQRLQAILDNFFLNKVRLMDAAQAVSADQTPFYEVAYKNGRWGKVQLKTVP